MASTNFRVFNEEMNTDRTFSDSEYEVATQRELGVIPGMANSRLHNKMYRQSTAMAKAVADFLVSQGYDVMDNDIPSITENIEKAITTLIKSKTTEDLTEHNTAPDAHEDIRTAIAEATKKAGLPIGYTYTVDYTELQEGQLALLGGKYLKSTFADLWAWVQTHPSMIVTETEWQAIKTASGGRAVPKYADVDDQYFRVPLVTTWVRGASSLDEVGAVLEAGLPNITGQYRSILNVGALDANHLQSGAFLNSNYNDNDINGYVGSTTAQGKESSLLDFDASKSNAIYGKSTTVQPQSVCRLWVVQAFGTNSNVGNMDVAQVAQGITDLTSRVSTLEADSDFTIIYPNGGSKETPANVAINSRYVMDNPFSGYEVSCRAEVLYNGMWNDARYTSGTSSTAYGVHASIINTDQIVVQTGVTALVAYSAASGNGFGITSNVTTSLACRVKVWKVGKIS